MAEAASAVEFAGVGYALAGREGESGRVLLRGVDLKLEAGTTTAVLGRSGSGKTTLLRMVNGLTMPTAGEVRVGKKATREWSAVELRRGIGYVIQEAGLFPHMTVERNVGMALELAGGRGRRRRRDKDRSRSLRDDKLKDDKHFEYEARVREVMVLAGLDAAEFRGRYPWQLSGGQRQRVGLARALAGDPGVLLMDEPFGALDPMTRAEMQTMLRELLARVGKTVLLVTHDLDEALFLAGRVVFLEAGGVVADLRAEEVMGSENAKVREYVRAVRRGS
jgi:osmoprotectant transport system ATP-binding protein